MTTISRRAQLGRRRRLYLSTPALRSLLLLFALLASCTAAKANGTVAAASNWSNVDVGAVGAPGYYSLDNGTLTVSGSGADIWNTADGFQFVYQTLTGDGSITARVISQTNTSSWAKAGVMFRETLNAGSTFADAVVTAGNGVPLQARTTTGSSAVHTTGLTTIKAPYWVRLVRSGSTFAGFASPDGANWTSLGQYTIAMTSQAYVGLAVTSHASGTLSTAVFDNVTITSNAAASATPPVTVAISPSLASVAVGRTQTFVATVLNGAHGSVTWKVNGVTGGTSTVGTISSAGVYAAPAAPPTPATVTVTAVSIDDPTKSASASLAIVTASARPTIGGAPPTTAAVGSAYSFTPATTSASGAKLTFSIVGRPAWATFNAASGNLSGIPASGDIGTFANVSISVSDGTTIVSLPAFTITVGAGVTGSATFSWTPPTTRVDGTPLANLAGYRIYYGTSPGNYSTMITVANPGLTTYVIANLPAATYYFACSAYDATGLASADSASVSKVIQ